VWISTGTSYSQRRARFHYGIGRNRAVIPFLPTLKPAWTRLHAQAVRHWLLRATGEALGVINLKDIVKGGIKERFAQLRKMGIKTVMITGDNPLTAAAIAAEAGSGRFSGSSHTGSETQINSANYQSGGRLVAMTATARTMRRRWAQADVAVAK